MARKKVNKRREITPVSLPGEPSLQISSHIEEWKRNVDFLERRMFLYGSIINFDEDDDGILQSSRTAKLVENILTYNRIDRDIPPAERIPIILYINSPGGEPTEGFSLISAIELSKTPIYTVNIGQWSSMSFLIGITGHRRFSFPYMTFLMHDGSQLAFGSSSKVQDQIEFSKRFEDEIVRKHVLNHSKMKRADYDALSRVEFYMLPEDALAHGFIDEIVTDLEDIL